jgi:hypothetical protein
MPLINEIKEMFINLFVAKDKIGMDKEMYNFEIFTKSLRTKDVCFDLINSSKRKNCIYLILEDMIEAFCEKNNICLDILNKTITIVSMLDSYNSCRFLYEENGNKEISLDKLLGVKLKYTRLIAKNLISVNEKDAKTRFNIDDNEVLLKFVTDLILMRYTFKSNLLKFKFEKKWMIELREDILKDLEKSLYINNDVRFKESNIFIKKDEMSRNVINNSSFNKDIWINKFNLIKETNDVDRNKFFDKENTNISKVLNIINFLNNSNFVINKDLLTYVINDDNIKNKLIEEKKIMTLLALKEAEYLCKFDKFHFDYIMDNRTRLYIKNIPLNTQLEKILRPLVITNIDDDFIILNKYKRFIKDFKEVIKISDLFSVLKRNKKDIYRLLDSIEDLLKRKNIKKEKIMLDIENKKLSIELIFIQQVLDILEKFKINGDCLNKEKELDDLVIEYAIKDWIKNKEKWIKIMWYNDASSNVLQILILKLFIWEEETLKICNIFDNDTIYKDVYEYIVDKLKNKNNREIVTRKLIKSIVMPGLYGQTFISMKNNFDIILEKNDVWLRKNKKERLIIIKEIEKEVWNELNIIKLNLSDYLKILKRLPYETKNIYWKNMIGMPILLDKEKSLDRKKILIKIKKNRINRKENENKKLKEILNKDDKNYIRKNIKIEKNKYIKIRYKIKSNIIDKKSLSNSLTPSSNHADDASILFETLDNLKKYKIKSQPIHDSIGTMIYYSSINKMLFKISNIEFINFMLKEERFPFDVLEKTKFKSEELEKIKIKLLEERKLNKNYYENNKKYIFKKILESRNFFN